MNLYIYKPTPDSLTINVIAAESIQEAFEAGRYVIKDRQGNKWDVVLIPKSKAVCQERLFV